MKTKATSIFVVVVFLLAGPWWSAIASCEPPSQSPEEHRTVIFHIVQDDKSGFINEHGNVVVAPKYDIVFGSGTDCATAHDSDGWWLIEGRDGVVIEPLACPHDAIAVCRIGAGLYRLERLLKMGDKYTLRYAIFDPRGLFTANWDENNWWGVVREGLLPFKQGDKWGFVDPRGALVIKPDYDHVGNFFEGKAVVTLGGKDGYINRNGVRVIEPQFLGGYDFSDGMALVCDARAGNAYRYITTDGTPAFEARFSSASSFTEGLASVRERDGGHYGYIDRTGRFVIEPKFDRADKFSDGLAAVVLAADPRDPKRKAKGYIDHRGQLVIEIQLLKDLYYFHRGLALVRTEDWMGYIDKCGRCVWKTSHAWLPPAEEQVWPPSENSASSSPDVEPNQKP